MGKTILITGASSGIGRETAEKLAEAGHKIFACIRKKSDKIRLEGTNPNIKGVFLDVTSQKGIDKAFWYVLNKTASLDAIICCAGIAVAGPVEALPLKRIKEQFDVNTFGAIAVIQKFLPLVSEGKIIYVSSMASSGIFPFLSPYCASKRAADIMLNSLANEFKNDKIKFVSIKPGVIKTPLWDKSIDQNMPVLNEMSDNIKNKYSNEIKYLQMNAEKNNQTGLNVREVADIILKAFNSAQPKSSYTVGLDSSFVMFFSKFLPESLLNSLIKKALKYRISKIK